MTPLKSSATLDAIATLLSQKGYAAAAWQGRRIYLNGIGYNTKKVATKAYLSFERDLCEPRVYVESDQPKQWNDAEAEHIAQIHKLGVLTRWINANFVDRAQASVQTAERESERAAVINSQPVVQVMTTWTSGKLNLARLSDGRAVATTEFPPKTGDFIRLTTRGTTFSGEEWIGEYKVVTATDAEREAVAAQIAALDAANAELVASYQRAAAEKEAQLKAAAKQAKALKGAAKTDAIRQIAKSFEITQKKATEAVNNA